MPTIEHNEQIDLQAITRAEIRLEVLQHFIAEEPGDRENRHKYLYHAETLADGSKILLKRPAWKNKGIDFEIWCDNFRPPRACTRPSHSDIVDEIEELVNLHPESRNELLLGIRRVWNCERPTVILAEMPAIGAVAPVERLLKLLRWLFIEQDLTYWVESGRWMLRGKIEDAIGVLP